MKDKYEFEPPFRMVPMDNDFEGGYWNIWDTNGQPMLYVAPDKRSVAAAKLLIQIANSHFENDEIVSQLED